jgi:hypothetical protein
MDDDDRLELEGLTPEERATLAKWARLERVRTTRFWLKALAWFLVVGLIVTSWRQHHGSHPEKVGGTTRHT